MFLNIEPDTYISAHSHLAELFFSPDMGCADLCKSKIPKAVLVQF
jgi:hypothetical protein